MLLAIIKCHSLYVHLLFPCTDDKQQTHLIVLVMDHCTLRVCVLFSFERSGLVAHETSSSRTVLDTTFRNPLQKNCSVPAGSHVTRHSSYMYTPTYTHPHPHIHTHIYTPTHTHPHKHTHIPPTHKYPHIHTHTYHVV